MNDFEVDQSTEEAGRSVRSRKRNSELICPVCGITIRANEIETHFSIEMQRLQSCNNNNKSGNKRPSASTSTSGLEAIEATSSSSSSASIRPESAWGTFQKIKTNRQARLKTKSRKRKSIENICPVCNRLTSEEIHVHVEKCLNRMEKRQKTQRVGVNEESDTTTTDDEVEDDQDSIDIVGGTTDTTTSPAVGCSGIETYEEYEWAGQTRIRVSSMLPGGGYSGVGMRSTNTTTTDEDLNVNVDGDDDTTVYGQSQFTEKDVIPAAQSLAADNYLRSLIAGETPSKADDSETDEDEEQSDDDKPTTTETIQGQIVESLKSRLREYEKQASAVKNKCQICLEDYKSPVVSISCWHVLCKQCWLRCLGARKLCPKCNMITAPADLRRIYL